ncbi:MAG: peptide deformylase [Candidatus Moranbacteria bacterium]|nr:peptide deformylase [Candidatus Moranbacteria bacterium]
MKIVTYPNPVLETKAQKIKDPLDKEIQSLIPKMIKTMRESNGIGLAAPQIGKSIRLCIVEIDKKAHVLINPKITSASKSTETSEEGCLSFPGKIISNIKRSEKVTVRYLNEKGERCKMKGSGLIARVFQHEIDHLDGILFIQRSK